MFWVYLAILVGCFLMMLGFWEVALRHSHGPEEVTGADVPPEKLTGD